MPALRQALNSAMSAIEAGSLSADHGRYVFSMAWRIK
jgi:hypothetical protein